MSRETCVLDALQPIPMEEWPLLQNIVQVNWPTFGYYYYWIENAIVWKKKDPSIQLQIYSIKENFTHNTFIGISTFSVCIVVLFTQDPSNNVETLKKAIAETKHINWDRNVYFPCWHEVLHPILPTLLEHIKDVNKVKISSITHGNYMFKSADDCLTENIIIPEECYLSNINESHIPLIHSLWPHQDQQEPELSVKYLKMMVKMNKGLGLFLKKDNSLVSWVLHTDWYGLGTVQTAVEHKRKGYASIVIKAMSKYLAEQGIPSGLFIFEGNTASKSMFNALGWKRVASVKSIMINKHDS